MLKTIALRIAWSALLLLPLSASAEEQMLRSPRLNDLQAKLKAGAPDAREQFWADVKKEGTPLIEPAASDPRRVLVTFLWRGDSATNGVFVIALDHLQFSNRAYLEHGRMTLLPGTDVWYRTYEMRCDARFSYRMSAEDPPQPDKYKVDPNNPKHYLSRNGDTSVAELPCAPPQPEIVRRDGVGQGTLSTATVTGASGESHTIDVYTPAGYSASNGPYNLIVFVSGSISDDFPVATILDNLIAGKRIPPSVAVMIEFTSMSSYTHAMRSDEGFSRYVAVDLLNWIRGRFNVSRDPRRTVVVGSSAAGAGALFVAMRHPSLFGNVLSQSGGYVYPIQTPPDELVAASYPEAEPLARELASTPRLPLRIFLAAGSLEDVEWEGKTPRYGMTTVLVAARHLRDVLEAKGYPMLYREFAGLHESLSWRGTLVEGLVYLFGPDRR